MKKLILSLVLAAITLPAMADISQSHVIKVSNALATLEAFGIDHTVVADDVSGLNLSYTWDNGNYSWTKTFTEALSNKSNDIGSLIINPGVGQNWYATTTTASAGGRYNTVKLYTPTDTNANSFTQLSITKFNSPNYWISSYTKIGSTKYDKNTSSDIIEDVIESYYDSKFANADQNNVHQESDGVLDSLSGDISGLIIDNAKGLKETIKNISYQVVAAEIGKSLTASCIATDGGVISSGACAVIGSKFLDINSKVTNIIASNTGFKVTGANWASNDGFYAYLEQRTDSYINGQGEEIFFGSSYSVYQRIDDNGNRWGSAVRESNLSGLGGTVTEGNLLGTYQDSLEDISILAGALSDLSDENSTMYRVTSTGTQTWVADWSINPAWNTDQYGAAYRELTIQTDSNGNTWEQLSSGYASESWLFGTGLEGTYIEGGIATFADIDWSI